ncbi:hypothetical protein CNR22_19975 [Sphingobacteriaceae bacterium]|nr:hypothetical protein CNR22_19975 [Sphingobacteriaceae bacterium]
MRITIFFLTLNLLVKSQIPSSGLVGAWPFSGNANDISLNLNHGTVSGATLTNDRCGNPNSAYHFNGTSDYISMLSAGPTGSASRSLSFWAKTTNTNLMCLFAYGNGTAGEAIGFQYNYNCTGVGIDVNNQALTRGNSCIIDGQWHHIVAVLNSSIGIQLSSVDFYVDAILLSSITCVITGSTQTINTGSMFPISIGKIHDAQTRFFSGDLDDFYLYDRALSLADIQQLYNACSAPIFGNTAPCQSAQSVYSVTPMGTGSYTWSLPSGWTGSSSTNTLLATSGINSGVISVSVSGSCGARSSSSLAVNVSSIQVSLSGNSNTICTGQTVSLTVSGASTYTWMPGSQTGSLLTVTPSVSTIYIINAQHSSGCALNSTVNISVSKCTDIKDLEKNNSSAIFPNPGNGYYKTNLKGSYSVQVKSTDGKLVFEKKFFNENIEIDIASYPSGVYFARLSSENGTENIKLIKNR